MNQLLHSKIIGSGEPLIILHGFLGMSDNWKTLGSKYAEIGLEVHLIDQRNHGKSFHSEHFNYDFLTTDLKAYFNHYQIKKANIIGHSMGGKTAMQFACDYPNLTKKLIIADISPKYYPPHHNEILNGLNALDFNIITSRSQADKELAEHITDYSTRQFLLKNLFWIEKGRLDFRFNLKILGVKMEEIGENISATSIFDGPTLFLRGDRSEYITDADFPEIKRHFPKATLETIDNSGHWLHAENPKQFFEKSVKFIKS